MDGHLAGGKVSGKAERKEHRIQPKGNAEGKQTARLLAAKRKQIEKYKPILIVDLICLYEFSPF